MTGLMSAPDLYDEVHRYGITYVIGTRPVVQSSIRLQPAQLLVALAQCDEDYLRHTAIALLLLHPDWVPQVNEALRTCAAEVAADLEVLILATCYLQQRWYLHLGLALGEAPHVPVQTFARLWEHRGLPSPAIAFGECGLTALEAEEQQRMGTRFAYRDAWDSPIHHLLWQERHWRDQLLTVEAIAPITLVPSDGLPEKPLQYATVDRDHLVRFVTQVAQHIPGPDWLVLGSETTGVLSGLHAATDQLDIHIGRGEVLSPALETALRTQRAHSETAWVADMTADTIPLPTQWRDHTCRLSSTGQLTIDGLS